MLLSLLEDIEIVSKELLEYTDSHRHNEPSSLINLLTNKDAAFQHHIAIAKEQEVMQAEVEELEMEIEKRDVNIRQLQVNLKTAEDILSTIVYEAGQKLKSIEQASKRKVSSEELIKYAHKISASNCVNSPPNWMPGDARRPFPTEAEMRAGLLFTSEQQHNNNTLDRQLSGTFQYGAPGSLSWQPSVEVQSTLLNRMDKAQQQQAPPPQQQQQQQAPLKQLQRPNQQQLPSNNNNNSNINIQQQQQQVNKEEVDLMSSDSSSSSSSDE